MRESGAIEYVVFEQDAPAPIWTGFVEVGTAPAEDSGDTMDLMHHPLPWAG